MTFKTYGFASEFASRMESHVAEDRLKKKLHFDDIHAAEVLKRHLSLDLRRWI